MMKHTAKGVAATTAGLALAALGLAPVAANAASNDTAPTAGPAYAEQAQSLLQDAAV